MQAGTPSQTHAFTLPCKLDALETQPRLEKIFVKGYGHGRLIQLRRNVQVSALRISYQTPPTFPRATGINTAYTVSLPDLPPNIEQRQRTRRCVDLEAKVAVRMGSACSRGREAYYLCVDRCFDCLSYRGWVSVVRWRRW